MLLYMYVVQVDLTERVMHEQSRGKLAAPEKELPRQREWAMPSYDVKLAWRV